MLRYPRSLRLAISTIFLLLSLPPVIASAQEAAATPAPLSEEVKTKITEVQNAIKNSDAAIKRAEDRRQVADAQVNTLKKLTSSKKADGAALRDLADLIDVVDSVERAKFYVKNTPDNDHITLKDLDGATASSGNSLLSMVQMLAMSLGVAAAGAVLAGFTSTFGSADTGATVHAFGATFVTMGLITLSSAAIFWQLPPEARAPQPAQPEVSGQG